MYTPRTPVAAIEPNFRQGGNSIFVQLAGFGAWASVVLGLLIGLFWRQIAAGAALVAAIVTIVVLV